MNTSDRLRWGFLGAARIAAAYATAIRDSCNGLLGSVAARDPARAAAFARENGFARSHETYAALIEAPEIDAIYIALPNALHVPWALRAIEAGKHVLCEKPLGTNAEDVRLVQERAAASSLSVAEGIMYRRHPLNIRAMEILHSGRIGRLVSGHAAFFAPVGGDDPIRFSKELGGGALLDLGFYCASVLRWAAGEEPDAVHGSHTLHPGGVDTASAGLLQFPSGFLGTFACSYGTPFSCRYEFNGTAGRLVCDGGPLCAWPSGCFRIEVFDQDGTCALEEILPADHYRLMAEEFAAAALGNGDLRWGLDESLANQRVLDQLLV